MAANQEKLKKAIALLKLVSHPVRLSILCNLMCSKEMSVSEIVENEKISQSQISQFLNRMRSQGLIKNRKEAQTVYYSIDSLEAKQLIQALYQIYCAEP